MNPILSIITITYNNLNGLQFTCDTIDHKQDKVEHLIIDGSSTDGTKEYLRSLDGNATWISEKDKGIYDAMNKGISESKGDYLLFMNAGDGLNDDRTITELIVHLSNNPDVLYGKTMLVDQAYKELGLRSEITTRKLPEDLSWKSMQMGMMVCHQSFIAKKQIAPYYTENNFSADVDAVRKCLKKAKKIQYYNGIIASFLVGGISEQKKFKSLADRFRVISSHFGILGALSAHLSIGVRYLMHKLS